MKKKYFAPKMEVIVVKQCATLLAGSPVNVTEQDYEVIVPGGGIPSAIAE